MIYRENLERIVDVDWSAKGLYVFLVVDSGTPTLDRTVVMAPYPPGRVAASGAEFVGVLTGATSLSSVDLSAVPVSASIHGSSSSPPGCVRTMSDTYFASGAPSVSTPGIGYNITSLGVIVVSRQSFGFSDPNCTGNLDSPALPQTWILGERVTVT